MSGEAGKICELVGTLADKARGYEELYPIYERVEKLNAELSDKVGELLCKLDDRDRTIRDMQERFGAEVASRMPIASPTDPIPLIPPGPTIDAGRADEIEEQYKSLAHRVAKVEGVINSWWKAGGFTPPNSGD